MYIDTKTRIFQTFKYEHVGGITESLGTQTKITLRLNTNIVEFFRELSSSETQIRDFVRFLTNLTT